MIKGVLRHTAQQYALFLHDLMLKKNWKATIQCDRHLLWIFESHLMAYELMTPTQLQSNLPYINVDLRHLVSG